MGSLITMKKLLTILVLGLSLFSLAAVASANEYVPDTSLIDAKNKLVIMNPGTDSEMPVWISHNPTCYNAQELRSGIWESFIDVETETVYVYKNGDLVEEIKL